jgi:hypothetical protein
MWLGGEDQDKTWLDGPVASVKDKLKALNDKPHGSGKLEQPMDQGNSKEQVRSRSMNQ